MKQGKTLFVLLVIVVLFGVVAALTNASKKSIVSDQTVSTTELAELPFSESINQPQQEETSSKTMESYTTVDGMQITITRKGSGAEAKSGDTVSVHYTGMFEDGKVFDSSVTRGTPFTFILGAGQVIKGWDEGVVGMKVGEKRTLVIPYTLAYGENGYGPIPPKATLVFDVELLEVK